MISADIGFAPLGSRSLQCGCRTECCARNEGNEMKKKIIKSVATDEIPKVGIELLKPYKNNARIHNDAQIARLVGSLNEFGWTRPIMVDEKMTILAGHGMWEAAKAAGETEVPVIMKTGLSAKQKRAYIIADNKLSELAKWDEGILALEIKTLDLELLELTGLSNNELLNLNPPSDVPDELDKEQTIPKKIVVKPGDAWSLGKHRIVCGDCTVPEIVDLCLDGATPHLMVTDPPYGVNYDANWRNEADRKNGKKIGAHAVMPVHNDDQCDWSAAWSLFQGDVAYVWSAGNNAHITAGNLVDLGFDIRAQIIWNKNNMVIGRGHYHPKHEPLWYAVRNKTGATGHWEGGRRQTTVWEIDKPMKSETGHSTQKPIECMRRPILNNSKKGDAVYDPFLGSGTTVIACELEGRICYGIELSPEYCQMTINRWQDQTGQKAVKAKK